MKRRKKNIYAQRITNSSYTEAITWCYSVKQKLGHYPLFCPSNPQELTPELITALYALAAQLGLNCSPIILNYNNVFGYWAAKPFCDDFLNNYSGHILHRQGSYEGSFCGFHWGGSDEAKLATNLEYLLAFGINLVSGLKISLAEAFNKAVYKNKRSKQKISNEESVRTFCFDNVEKAKALGESMLKQLSLEPGQGYTACKNFKGRMLDEFMQAGGYAYSSRMVEAKADVTVYSKEEHYVSRVSVKMAGSSQGGSMQSKEFIATAATMGLNEEVLSKFREIYESLYTYTGEARK